MKNSVDTCVSPAPAGSDYEKFSGTFDPTKGEPLKSGLHFVELGNVSDASKQAFTRLMGGAVPGRHEIFVLIGTAANVVLIGRLSEKPKMPDQAAQADPEALTLDYLPLQGYDDAIEQTMIIDLQARFQREIQFNPIRYRHNPLEVEIQPGDVSTVILQRAT
jgi:hypothetical protein